MNEVKKKKIKKLIILLHNYKFLYFIILRSIFKLIMKNKIILENFNIFQYLF